MCDLEEHYEVWIVTKLREPNSLMAIAIMLVFLMRFGFTTDVQKLN
jgi:hypothetical protein